MVLQEQVAKYKQVFIEAVRQANKIDSALSVYFGDMTPAPDNGIAQNHKYIRYTVW